MELFAQGGDFICEWISGNLALRKLACQGVACQQPLCRIGQRLAGPVDATEIRRYQSIAVGEPCRNGRACSYSLQWFAGATGDHGAHAASESGKNDHKDVNQKENDQGPGQEKV